MEEVLDDLFCKNMLAKHRVYLACKSVVYDSADFIGNTKAAITAYTISVLVSLIKKARKVFDLSRIWRSQTIPVGSDSVFESVSVIINDLLAKKSLNKNMAVLSFAKSKDCFDAIMQEINKQEIGLQEDKLALFISSHERRAEMKEARQQREQDRDINALTLLVDFSAGSWRMYLSEI